MQNENRIKIAKFIKMQRIAQDLKQDELAKLAKLSTKTLQYIENAKEVRRSSIDKALDALGYRLEMREVVDIVALGDNI